ncbi:hypothetical protein MLD38_022103 [Melastoma candidum]|uniref:Uncharacterized protein n=1 Tax=Melastoma candidum TaxID=119954 RepID=A0ACB9QI18_9MYRT|nr:hypothetical protein MLD38_022103 [Melastoma candidum]
MEGVNGIIRPLLTGSNNAAQAIDGGFIRSRRFRRCKSAPLPDAVTAEAYFNSINHQNWSIFGSFSPSFVKVFTYMSVYFGIGTVCFYFVKNQIDGRKTNGIIDAVYFCMVTMTTVGYGDLVPSSPLAKLLACAFVFAGMALVGLILSKAADYLVERQEMLLVRALHLHNKVTPSEMVKELDAHKIGYKCVLVFILLLVLITSGTIFLAVVEKLNVVDAFYCVCCTITTLGYGDKSFSTQVGRVFAIVWILVSTICVAQFFLYVAELNTEKRRRKLVKWVLSRRMTNLDLEAADLDNNGVVGVGEFIVYKLKEMGKINQEDISLILQEFEELDVDQSGTLSVSDLALAQSSPPEK